MITLLQALQVLLGLITLYVFLVLTFRAYFAAKLDYVAGMMELVYELRIARKDEKEGASAKSA